MALVPFAQAIRTVFVLGGIRTDVLGRLVWCLQIYPSTPAEFLKGSS